LFIPNLEAKIKENAGKSKHLVKILRFASLYCFFGSQAAFSEAKLKLNKPKTHRLLFGA